MISEKAYREAAAEIRTKVPEIKAVAEVEGNGKGFLQTGEPVILFEPHIFYRALRKKGIDPKPFMKGNEDILYPIWGSKPYGRSTEQHARLQRAVKIDRTAALASASWGMFQILGENYKLAGFKTLQAFITAMYESEDHHLQAFVNYINNTYLDDELRLHDWAGFARGYNGAMYYKNNYDKKLKAAYEKYIK